MSDNEAIRRIAEKRLKAQSDVRKLAGVFVIVWLILTAIWAMSGGGYFWPMWAIFGMAIGLAFAVWGAYGPRSGPPSEDAVEREMKKYGSRDQ